MVQDTSLASLICWSTSGTSFTVYNPNEFAKTVLPQFFKHNNFQSFVRQVSARLVVYDASAMFPLVLGAIVGPLGSGTHDQTKSVRWPETTC